MIFSDLFPSVLNVFAKFVNFTDLLAAFHSVME